MDERTALAESICDADLLEYFYLDVDVITLARKLNELELELVESQEEVPFNAQVKSYLAAVDDRGDPWIVKPAASDEEMRFHRSCVITSYSIHYTKLYETALIFQLYLMPDVTFRLNLWRL